MNGCRPTDIQAEAKSNRDAWIDLYLTYKDRPLLDDNDEPMKYGNGRAKLVTQEWFAEAVAHVTRETFGVWLKDRGERQEIPQRRPGENELEEAGAISGEGKPHTKAEEVAGVVQQMAAQTMRTYVTKTATTVGKLTTVQQTIVLGIGYGPSNDITDGTSPR